jgi:putative nucleotidyltransferase with HDIG domain
VALKRTDSQARSSLIERSITLMRVFLVASAVILLCGAVIVTLMLTSTLRHQAVSDAQRSLTQYVDGVLRDELVHGDRLTVAPRVSAELDRRVRRQPDLVTVKVWRSDGVLIWTNRAKDRIGKRFELDDELGEAIRENRSVGSIGQPGTGEDDVERGLGFTRLLEVYAPVSSSDGRRAIGAYEIYADPRPMESFLTGRKHVVWLVVGLVFLALYAALALLVRTASTTLRRQTMALRKRSRELMESYRRLELSSVEAIETLNATVDAKDPYTAGHSQRVQEIALAVARELELDAGQLDALRLAAPLHDIGKLRVPDAILLKPGPLTKNEYEVIKRHPADGADIVCKLGRLREAVPLIRHHHERWDGKGYPDRLAGAQIPLAACVVGLADAWDAMTTDRPYHRALTREEAAEQVREGRGTQFAPEVVDALFRVLRRGFGERAGHERATLEAVG